MIPFDFEYYRPTTVSEAVKLYNQLQAQGKEPLYYCGGTEIITMARLNQLFTKAVIDIKWIPECQVFKQQDDELIIGSAIPLAQLEENKVFPLLSRTCNRIADHTSRSKITLGGNICGKIMYREAVLPILLADSDVVIAGNDGLKRVSIHDVFQEHIRLKPEEFLVQIITNMHFTTLPYVSEKRTKIDRIDYPLLSLAAVRDGNQIRVAISGLCSFPFRSPELEEELNAQNLPIEKRIQNACNHLPAPIISDMLGSSEYRSFVLSNTLVDAITELEGARS